MRYLILIAVIFFSGCITIKHLPAHCKPDTVYIEKESPLLFKPMPYYDYPVFEWIDTLSIMNIDTATAGTIKGGTFIIWEDSLTTITDTSLWKRYPLVDRKYYCDSIITRTDTSYKKTALKAQQMTNIKINIYENDGNWMESRIIDTCHKNKK